MLFPYNPAQHRTFLSLVALGTLGVAAIHPAQAQGTIVYNSDNGGSLYQLRDALDMSGFIQTQQFILTSPVTFNTIEFPDIDGSFTSFPPSTSSGYAGSLTYQFYTDNSGQPPTISNAKPGTLLTSVNTTAVTRSAPYSTRLGPGYLNDIAIASITLQPGTYWLGLHNGTLAQTQDQPGGFFAWQTTANPTDPVYNYGINLQDPSLSGTAFRNLNFQLINNQAPVPEASTSINLGLLLSLGLGGLITVRRKAKVS